MSPPPTSPGAVRGPRRLSRGIMSYLGWEVLKSFVLVIMVIELVLGSIFCFGAVREFGVDLGLLLPLLPPALAAYLDAAIPISLLFATALVYGRFIAEREVAAMKAFGFSYLELAIPPVVLGAAASLVVLVLNFYVIPELRFTRDNLGGIILERLRYLGEGSNQSFHLGENYALWIERFKGEKLEGIFIAAAEGEALGLKGLEKSEKGKVTALSYPLFVYAEEGGVVRDGEEGGGDLAIELRRVTVYYDDDFRRRDGPPSDFKQRLERGRLRLPVKVPQARRNDKEVTEGELRRRIAERRRLWEEAERRAGERPGDKAEEKAAAQARRFYNISRTEYHRRIAMALGALTFPLAAAALALFLNSPNWLLPLFVSLLTAPSIFYVLEMVGNSWGRANRAPWLTEELGNLGLAALAAALFLGLRRRTLW